MASEKVRVAIIGCGNISDIYLKNLTSLFKEIELLGVCDAQDELAQRKTEAYSLACRYHSSDELLADPRVEIVLDLCPPLLHYEINKKALCAGKHVYSEKPLAARYDEAKELLALAADKGLYIGCSPDTVLGAAVQTCRRLVDTGAIGDVVGCSANLIKRGVETWHPNPNFLYQPGAGPLLDMGPYYLGALLQIVGRIKSVSGMAGISFQQRVITSQPHFGEMIDVNVPTYVNALLGFESGAQGALTMTFDVYKANLPFLEIYGSEGSLSVPDPNCFGASPILLYRPERNEWLEMPFMFGYAENSRGLGLADMARALRTGRAVRASGEAACHTVEIIEAILASAEQRREITLESPYSRPAPMVNSPKAGMLD
ncbi:MAG: Gfo/Idh/MocA family oxidoreductase [Candidatus Pelethousia sp.]|nr:Gfo/Idh/MocA family oxidoreductase [Candidatus Pelethousia sp.]